MWTTGLVFAALYPLSAVAKLCKTQIKSGGDLLGLLIGFGVVAATEVAIIAAIRFIN